jgi:uncharacterized protein (DUF427 family)
MKYVATFNGRVIAESENTKNIEGNQYFPKSDVKEDFLSPSDTTTVCPWKGTANYYTVQVEGEEGKDAAWYYADPKPAAEAIKDHVAFWKGVEVSQA